MYKEIKLFLDIQVPKILPTGQPDSESCWKPYSIKVGTSARGKDRGNRRKKPSGGGRDNSKMMIKTSSKVTVMQAAVKATRWDRSRRKKAAGGHLQGKKELTHRLLNAPDNSKQSFATWKRICGWICDSYMEQMKM